MFSRDRFHHASVVLPSKDIVLVGGEDEERNGEIFNFNSDFGMLI